MVTAQRPGDRAAVAAGVTARQAGTVTVITSAAAIPGRRTRTSSRHGRLSDSERLREPWCRSSCQWARPPAKVLRMPGRAVPVRRHGGARAAAAAGLSDTNRRVTVIMMMMASAGV